MYRKFGDFDVIRKSAIRVPTVWTFEYPDGTLMAFARTCPGGCAMPIKARLASMTALLRPGTLLGPILDKEMRVTARRRRYYALRSAYLGLLMLLMLLIWSEAMSAYDGRARQSAEMSETGKIFVAFVTWFQFIGLQIVTVFLLSTAISEEVERRTLAVLLTTPITSVQIVAGKILSKLLHLLHLFALSIPLLILIRVFGGIPWSYLLSSWCITLTSVLFLAAMTLFYSIHCRQGYIVLILTAGTAAILWGLVPILLVALTNLFWWDAEEATSVVIGLLCPSVTLTRQTEWFLGGGWWRGGWSYGWLLHCGVLAAMSVALVWLSCRQVRLAALRSLVPKTRRPDYPTPTIPRKAEVLYRPLFLHSLIRRTLGPGMIWKEFLTPILGRWRFVLYTVNLLIAVLFIATLGLTILLETIEPLILFVLLLGCSIATFLFIAVMLSLTVPATCITREKEARTWETLLTTCLTDGQILGGKIIGILRRVGLVWLPAIAVLLLAWHFSNSPVPLLIAGTVLGTTSSAVLIGSGLYFSSRLRRSTGAVLANMTFLGVIWGLVPVIASVLGEYATEAIPYYAWFWRKLLEDAAGFVVNATPIGLALTTFEASTDPHLRANPHIVHYWLVYTVIHATLAGLLFVRARANLRKRLT